MKKFDCKPVVILALLLNYGNCLYNVNDNSLEIPTPYAFTSIKEAHLEGIVHFINPPPKTAEFKHGVKLVLICGVVGYPDVHIVWLKNGLPVLGYEVKTYLDSPADPSSLTHVVSKLLVMSAINGDLFTCMATSALNQKTASTTVYIDEGYMMELPGFLPCRSTNSEDSPNDHYGAKSGRPKRMVPCNVMTSYYHKNDIHPTRNGSIKKNIHIKYTEN